MAGRHGAPIGQTCCGRLSHFLLNPLADVANTSPSLPVLKQIVTVFDENIFSFFAVLFWGHALFFSFLYCFIISISLVSLVSIVNFLFEGGGGLGVSGYGLDYPTLQYCFLAGYLLCVLVYLKK